MIGSSSQNQNSVGMSEDSEMEVENAEENKYHSKYQLLLGRCDSIQQDNERIVYR